MAIAGPIIACCLCLGVSRSGRSHPAASFASVVRWCLLTGPSNAGKSTAAEDAWCNQRALVSDIAGTTVIWWQPRWRCVVGVFAIDSAGLRETDDHLERAGQDLVAQARSHVDAVCWLEPGDQPPALAQQDVLIAGKADLRQQEVDWGIPVVGT